MNQPPDIKGNLSNIEQLVVQSCQDAQRNRGDVQVIAVSKGHNFSAIKTAYECGQRHFGESYALEMAQKMALAQQQKLMDITWHFMGAIQSNKINSIVKANFIHSVGSMRHANLLNDVSPYPLSVFLQVNLDENPKRQGFAPSQVVEAAIRLQTLPKIQLVGLMCIPPQDENHKPSFWFQRMQEYKKTLVDQGNLAIKLSMGMSEDFVDAILNGANYVRIGTRIFGDR